MRAISLLFHDVYLQSPEESGFPSDAAHRYKLPRPDFEAQLAGIADGRADAPGLAMPSYEPFILARAIPKGSPHDLPYLITFDDGGVSYYTIAADCLEHLGWRGHCFVTTNMIGSRGFLDAARIRELDARGHAVGSHSASHPRRFSALTVDRMREEWRESRHTLEDILGHAVEIASVPGGYFSNTVARAARDAGIRVLFTSEPVTSIGTIDGCRVVGRFTIRSGDAPDAARRFLSSPAARSRAWLDWNAKGLVKPLLGPAYVRFTDWLAAH